MAKYVGIDPSLTSAAVVVYDTETQEYSIASFSSKADEGTISSRFERLESLALNIVTFITQDEVIPTLVGIEGPAFSSNTGKAWDRAGLWWFIVQSLLNLGIPLAEIPPTTRAKYATGSGAAGKDTVLLEVARNYDAEVRTNDEADALVICAFVARLDNNPFDGDLPKNKLESITKLKKDQKWQK